MYRDENRKSENDSSRQPVLALLLMLVIGLLSATLITVLFITGLWIPALIVLPVMLCVIAALIVWTVLLNRRTMTANQASSKHEPPHNDRIPEKRSVPCNDDSALPETDDSSYFTRKTDQSTSSQNTADPLSSQKIETIERTPTFPEKEDPFGDIFGSSDSDSQHGLTKKDDHNKKIGKPIKKTDSIVKGKPKETTDDLFDF